MKIILFPFRLLIAILVAPFRLLAAMVRHPFVTLLCVAILYVLVAMTLMVNGDMGATSRDVLSTPGRFIGYVWSGVMWMFSDLWRVGGHLIDQISSNLHELSKGADETDPFYVHIVMWTVGGTLYIAHAIMETFLWWLRNGHCTKTIFSLSGISIVVFLLLPSLGLAAGKK